MNSLFTEKSRVHLLGRVSTALFFTYIVTVMCILFCPYLKHQRIQHQFELQPCGNEFTLYLFCPTCTRNTVRYCASMSLAREFYFPGSGNPAALSVRELSHPSCVYFLPFVILAYRERLHLVNLFPNELWK